MKKPIVIAAGGTGGHTFPAQATAQALIARGRRVLLATDPRGAAFAEKVPGAELLPIRSATFSGRNPVKIAGALIEIMRGAMQARAAFRRERPGVVVGFGGYPALPSMLAARRTGTPFIVHESNAMLGRVNRLAASGATRIATAFTTVERLPRGAEGRTALVGNPVRPAVVEKASLYEPPVAEGCFNVLVFGGSQGARVMSEVVPAALDRLPADLKARLRLTQQARGEDLDMVRRAYAANGIDATTSDFFTDLPERLAGAHLAISRAGASTCAEMTAMGRPSILVPFPFATDDHQSFNARALESEGAAIMRAQPDFTPDWLAGEIVALAADPQRLSRIAAGAKALGRPNAAEDFADLIESVER